MNVQLRQILLYTKAAKLCTFAYKVLNTKTINDISESLEKKFMDVLVQPKIQKETWESIRKYVIDLSVHPSIVDPLLLNVLKEKKLVDVGISYYQFLAKNNYDLTVTTQTYFLELYEYKGTINKKDEKCILSLYEHFMDKYTSFEIKMSSTLVKNLCNIGEWRKAITVIQKFEKNDTAFLRYAYDDLISYLYNCGEADKAYEYLVISFKKGSGPMEPAYRSYLKYHLTYKHTVNKKIEELFSLWRQYGVNPSEQTILEYTAVCNNLGWSAKQAKLEGMECSVCKQKLLDTLSDKDYERLCKITEQKLIFEMMYYVSDPIEIRQFIKFVNAGKPYDVIIDGLNFIYGNINGYKRLGENLVHNKKKGKKVLVIARKHVKPMIQKMNFEKLANYFFFENLSKDDPFILYAAFASGRNCKILSNDLMRQHKFAIGDTELNVLFKRWQILQQCTFNKQDTMLRQNVSVDGIAYKQLNCWHIPYKLNSIQPRRSNIFKSSWMCFNMCP
ncbi:Mitochondrial ribonuclease P catalytic subunit [Anthophora retusa]